MNKLVSEHQAPGSSTTDYLDRFNNSVGTNRDTNGLGAMAIGPFVIGSVDAINGEDGKEVPEFIATRHELKHLVTETPPWPALKLTKKRLRQRPHTWRLKRSLCAVKAPFYSSRISAPPMNLLGPELVRDLVTLIQKAEADESVRVPGVRERQS